MEKQLFISIVERYYPWISCLEKAAFQIHDDVNQKYDHVLPYGFHLKMVGAHSYHGMDIWLRKVRRTS